MGKLKYAFFGWARTLPIALVFALAVALVFSCSPKNPDTQTEYNPMDVSLADVFLALPDTTPHIVEGFFSRLERQELLDGFFAQASYRDGETSMDFFDEELLSVGVSNGFGGWELNCIPMNDAVLAIVICDVNTDDFQAFEFYIFKDGKATKTEDFGYSLVRKKTAECIKGCSEGLYDYVALGFNPLTGLLELSSVFWGGEGTEVWSDYFAFSLLLNQFVELKDYEKALGKAPDKQRELLYTAFAEALDAKNYLGALQYVSRSSFYQHNSALHDCSLDEFLFSVLLSGECVSGAEHFAQVYDFSDVKAVRPTKMANGNWALELEVAGGNVVFVLATKEESVKIYGEPCIFFEEVD